MGFGWNRGTEINMVCVFLLLCVVKTMDRNELFRILVRDMHKFIKMNHHLKNLGGVEEEPGPRSLQRVARWLGSVVVYGEVVQEC